MQVYFLCDQESKTYQFHNAMQWSTSIYIKQQDFMEQLITQNLRTTLDMASRSKHPSAVFYLTKMKLKEVK